MTPTELKDLIAATIAGQGTNIDAGGSLPKILNGIIDLLGGGAEPLTVRGDVDSTTNVFTPRTGQPTQADAIAAFIEGRPVILAYDFDGMEGNYALITCFDNTANALIAYINSRIQVSWE